MLRKSSHGPIAWKSKIRPQQSTGNLRYLTLDLDSDPHTRAAIEAYADSCETEMPWLAEILREKLGKMGRSATHCDRTTRRLVEIARGYARTQPDYSDMAWEHVVNNLDFLLKKMHRISDKEMYKISDEESD